MTRKRIKGVKRIHGFVRVPLPGPVYSIPIKLLTRCGCSRLIEHTLVLDQSAPQGVDIPLAPAEYPLWGEGPAPKFEFRRFKLWATERDDSGKEIYVYHEIAEA